MRTLTKECLWKEKRPPYVVTTDEDIRTFEGPAEFATWVWATDHIKQGKEQ